MKCVTVNVYKLGFCVWCFFVSGSLCDGRLCGLCLDDDGIVFLFVGITHLSEWMLFKLTMISLNSQQHR